MKRLAMVAAVILGLAFASPALASKKLFVGNLPWGATAAQLRPHVSPFGPIISITVVGTDQDGDRSAEAKVEFQNPWDADSAAAALDGSLIGGEPVSAKVREIVVVGSKVKDVVRGAGLYVGPGFLEAFSEKVHEILEAAIKRSRANGRSTVRPYDLQAPGMGVATLPYPPVKRHGRDGIMVWCDAARISTRSARP